jgi:hypothetical protein
MKWSIYYNIWSFECIIFYGDLEPKPVPGIWAATITLIQINSACCEEKWADCDPEEQEKSKVRVMPCAASASPQVLQYQVLGNRQQGKDEVCLVEFEVIKCRLRRT